MTEDQPLATETEIALMITELFSGFNRSIIGMNKGFLAPLIYLLFITLLFGSCSSVSTSLVTPISPTVTPIPTIKTLPTTTANTDTLPPPDLKWSDEIHQNLISIGAYNGRWSPVANEILLDNSSWYFSSQQIIAKAEAPDFSIHTLSVFDISTFYTTTDWSPDGKYIVFNGPYPNKPPYQVEYAGVWVMNQDGSNLHILQTEKPANLRRGFYGTFMGWSNNTSVFYRYGAGSGVSHVQGLDIISGDTFFSDYLSSGVYAPHNSFIPSFALGNTQFIDTRYFESSKGRYEAPYVRRLEIDGKGVLGVFQDWQPNSNSALMVTTDYEVDQKTPLLELALWNLDTDKLKIILPNAIYAKYTNNGRTIAYITLGSPTLNAEDQPVERTYTVESRNQTRYIQLFDIESGTVTLSLPILIKKDLYENTSEYSKEYLFPTPYMALSTDSKYLAFLMPGADGYYLIVQDIKKNETITSVPASILTTFGNRDGTDILPMWSPDNKKLIYADEQYNLNILYIDPVKNIQVTTSGGNYLEKFSWSYDGKYLLIKHLDNSTDLRILKHSYVLKVP